MNGALAQILNLFLFFIVYNKKVLPFQQFILFCRTMGIGKTIKMVHKYPQFIITPALTFWTYDTVDISKAYCSICSGFRKKSKKISIRYSFSFI